MIATGVQMLQRLVVHGVVGQLHVLSHCVVDLLGNVSVELLAESLEVGPVGLLVDAFLSRPLHGETGDVGGRQLLRKLVVPECLRHNDSDATNDR